MTEGARILLILPTDAYREAAKEVAREGNIETEGFFLRLVWALETAEGRAKEVNR